MITQNLVYKRQFTDKTNSLRLKSFGVGVTMANKEVNPDLTKERRNCTFNPLELTHLLDGGKKKTEARRAKEKFFLEDPALKSSPPIEYLSHKEKYEEAVRRACIVTKKTLHLLKENKSLHYYDVFGGQLEAAILKDGNPLALQHGMFIPCLIGQGTPEQHAEWLTRAENFDIIGTYAQTELGHGTFVRGLETEAVYDRTTQEFILNCPTITAYKWWPGNLGHTANYAIVMAQLYTQGVCRGVHAFVAQLRDEETHMPLPGVKIGEIGSKLGMNHTNNGYLGFQNYRIPLKNLLMKNAKVLKDGTYVKAAHSKLAYGTMVFVRVFIVESAASGLKKAATIATRYSAVRRQSQIKEGDPEPQILDFVTQQYKIFPQIAGYFAYHYAAAWLRNVYLNVSSELEAGRLDRLPELHALSCCLKAVSADDAAAGVETCRLACGGHGYMSSSNFPQMYGLVTPMVTYEGENTVLHLQTARYLMKEWKTGLEGKSTIKYLQAKWNSWPEPFEKSMSWIISALERVAANKIELAARHVTERVKKGTDYDDARNDTGIELVNASETYCRAFVVHTYFNTTQKLIKKSSYELGLVLAELCELYAVNTALRYSGDLLRYCHISGKDIDVLQRWLEELLGKIRPNAVGIVDGFDLRDEILSSTLGAYDGNVYERLFDEASKSPLNAELVNKSFHLYLKPLLKAQL